MSLDRPVTPEWLELVDDSGADVEQLFVLGRSELLVSLGLGLQQRPLLVGDLDLAGDIDSSRDLRRCRRGLGLGPRWRSDRRDLGAGEWPACTFGVVITSGDVRGHWDAARLRAVGSARP